MQFFPAVLWLNPLWVPAGNRHGQLTGGFSGLVSPVTGSH